MRGRTGRWRCRTPGHGSDHMDGARYGQVCEVTAEARRDPSRRTDEKRQAAREIAADLAEDDG